MTKTVRSDILVIGSGLAGLNFSIQTSENSDFSIALVTKKSLSDANTSHAQGGIAAVLSENDNFHSHIEDTLVAGDGLCRLDSVEFIVRNGPKAVKTLRNYGVNFDRGEGQFIDLGREGGHHIRRVAHVKDTTGLAIENAVVSKVKQCENVQIYENHSVIDLIIVNGRVIGAYVFDTITNEVVIFESRVTILASGGAGKVFLYTTNPDTASGDGIAIAYRAGAEISNMEFMQFHPTLYYNPEFKTFLISETLRGEGAILKTKDGKRIMKGKHELEDLAPRDIVARAIDHQMKWTGDDFVYLDITHHTEDFLKNRFPGIFSTLERFGLNISKSPIPVVPASHYTVGGVRASVRGETSLPGLFAIGEVSYTGLHGANRLASNSLLEATVTSTACSKHIITLLSETDVPHYCAKEWVSGDAVDSDEAVIISNNWAELRRFMWNYVGIVRTTKRLLRAKARIDVLRQEVNDYYWKFKINSDTLELRNLVDVADLIVRSAIFRKESRGTHFTSDFPMKSDNPRDTIIQKNLGIYYSEIVNKS